MNTNYVLFNLREAREQLEQTIKGLETHSDYGEPEFSVEMAHLYHHINSAWNARNSTAAQSQLCSDEDFNKWSRYPSDLEEFQVG